ncbi:MAG: septum formation initiator family protein [Chloroflexi bacterium]|nr:septum formation initiator family protein [Chloroflexota bacterium]
MQRKTATATGRVAGRKRIRVRIPYVVLALLMVFFAYKFIQKTEQIRSLTAQENALRYENQLTAQENARLQAEIRYDSTPDYVRNQARAILGLTQPGEVTVQVTPRHPPAVAVRAGPPPVLATPPVPTWKQWWQTFFP